MGEPEQTSTDPQTKLLEEIARNTYTLRALAIAWTIAGGIVFLLAISGAF